MNEDGLADEVYCVFTLALALAIKTCVRECNSRRKEKSIAEGSGRGGTDERAVRRLAGVLYRSGWHLSGGGWHQPGGGWDRWQSDDGGWTPRQI